MVLFGLPGTGKSYLARRLARHLGATYISSDRLRRRMFFLPDYSEEEKRAVYVEMARQAKKALQKGWVVLDATFHRLEWRNILRHLSAFPPYYIRVTASEEVVRGRLEKTRTDSDADFAVHQRLKREFDSVRGQVLELCSTNSNGEDMLTKALNYLGRNNETS